MANWLSRQIGIAKSLVELSRFVAEVRSSKANQGIYRYLFGDASSNLKAPITQSERLATVHICIDFRARTRAMLPLNVFQTNGTSKEVALKHSTYQLLHNRPNPNMNAYQFWYAVEYCKHYHGNAFGLVKRQGRNVERIDLLNPEKVVLSIGKDGDIYYSVNGNNISSLDILHFKNFSPTGLVGLSTLEWHAETFGHSVDLRKFARRNLKSAPPAYATSQAQMPQTTNAKDQLKTYLQQEMEDYSTSGQMPFLYNGFEIKSMGLKPADAAYLEQISASKEDIYGIFGVNPGLIGSYKTGVTYNNLEQQGLQYLIYTLSSILTSDEQELNYKLFLPFEQGTYFCKFNEKALMRTDAETQRKWIETMFKSGLYNRNEIRELLDENPVPGGDVYYVEGNNMVPLNENGIPVVAAGAATKKNMQLELQQVLKEAGINTTLNGRLHYAE